MDTALTLREWNGKEIRQRADGWFSLTDMASAGDKRFANWHQLVATQELIQYAETITGIPVMVVKVGGNPEETGTWGHEDIAIDLAMWISIPFKYQVIQWAKEGRDRTGKEVSQVDFEATKVAEAIKPQVRTRGVLYNTSGEVEWPLRGFGKFRKSTSS